jgi:hypothetical protein
MSTPVECRPTPVESRRSKADPHSLRYSGQGESEGGISPSPRRVVVRKSTPQDGAADLGGRRITEAKKCELWNLYSF